MNELVTELRLPAMIHHAANKLTSALSAAEVLEARDMAAAAYDAAKRTARIAKARGAHDEVVAAAQRAQADALEIEAAAKRRLADEYDGAQERGEIGKRGDFGGVNSRGEFTPTAADIGVNGKQIHEARQIRDAEKDDPGVVRRVLDEAIEHGEEPTRAKINRVVKKKRKRLGRIAVPVESQHDRDLRALLGVWESSCETARDEFRAIINERKQ